jgi:erythromycin esterase
VDADASRFALGVMSFGKARVWVDEMSFEVVTERPPTPEEVAAREEIQKLNATLDAAVGSGKLDAAIALLAPGAQARSGASSESQSLRAAMEAIQQEIANGVKYLTRSTVTDLRLSGDQAIASVKEETTRIAASGRSEYVSTGRQTWTRTAEGWRLKQVVTLSARMLAPKTDPEEAKAVVAELKKRAVPLATVQAGSGFDDLAAFGKAVGEARIVALGEASHGTREFFQMKHRLLEYLVKEKGFTVFAIEGNWPEALAADRYIKAGEGDAASALASMYFWTWQTEEVRDMVEWMRAFNQAPGQHPTLTFTSFDMQTAKVAAQKALDYLKQYSPTDAAAAESAYAAASALDGGAGTDERAKAAFEQASAVLKTFDARRPAMEKASSPAA